MITVIIIIKIGFVNMNFVLIKKKIKKSPKHYILKRDMLY